jgi:hypothetical protein
VHETCGQEFPLEVRPEELAMDLEEYKRQYGGKHGVPGWDAIETQVKSIYPEQKPQHLAPPMHASIGGSEPLDGISIYKSTAGGIKHNHFVTYGFSELYFNEAAYGQEFSKFGFELTFRVKPDKGHSGVQHWAVNMLQNIAKYVFKSGNWFEPYDLMPAKGPLRSDTDTAIRAILFVPDAELGTIETPHGQVRFLQVFGITEKELGDTEQLYDKAVALAGRHQAINPLHVTDLGRTDG